MTDLCERCETNPAMHNDWLCKECLENAMEALFERSLGECFRGGEAEAYNAEQQASIQRNLK